MLIAEPRLIHSELFRSIGITACFSERQGGVSRAPFDSLNTGHGIGDDEHAVATNLNRLVAQAGLPSTPHQAEQTHDTGHLFCHGAGMIHDQRADILLATEANCPVSVRTADCLPVLLADPVSAVIAAVHAGWRGTAKQVVRRAVALMLEKGATSTNIHATLGPAIGPCCFEIGEEAALLLAASATNAGAAIQHSGKPHADLAAINIMQLKEAGLSEAHIESNHLCTCCHHDRFYSYRRDHGRTGRHLAVVALADAI